MTRLINAVFFVLLTSLSASARRVQHLEKVSLHTATVEASKKDNLNLEAGGPQDMFGPRGAAAKTLMQEVQRGDASLQDVNDHNVTQAMENTSMEFLLALKDVSSAIYADAKAAARAELYKNMDPGSDNARQSKNEANVAAAALIDAETLVCETTELLAGEPFGGETIVVYMLKGYDRGKETTVERVLERLHLQLQQLESETERVGFDPKDIVGIEKLHSHLSALDGEVEAMQVQKLDSDEIDLTKPLLLEANAMYSGIVKVMPEILKVQLNLLHKMVERRTNDEGKAVKGIKLRRKMKMKLLHAHFLKAVEKMEKLSAMQAIIQEAIEDFIKVKVSTLAAYRLAKDQLGQAVKLTLEQLETINPKMWLRQKASIAEVVKEKKQAMLNVPR